MTNPTRRSTLPIKVYCLPDERETITRLAGLAGLSASSYLLKVGLAHKVTGVLDHRRVEELLHINGDLGRLGGLLKLWLTDDVRTRAFGASTILAVLSKIEDTQAAMLEKLETVVLPRAGRNL